MKYKFLNDSKLSWKSKGILMYLIESENGYRATTSELQHVSKDSKDSVCTGLNELERNGYIRRVRLRNNGKMSGISITINTEGGLI